LLAAYSVNQMISASVVYGPRRREPGGL